MSSFYFTDYDVAVKAFPSLLVKSILKKAKNSTEVQSKKKVMFADNVRIKTFFIEDGRSMKSTKRIYLERDQKRQLKEDATRKKKREEEIKKAMDVAAQFCLMESMIKDLAAMKISE